MPVHDGGFNFSRRRIDLGPVYMRPRDEVNPGRSRFGHSIIYNRCLHETGMENAQTGLKSSRPLDRADYLQTGTNPERDECEHK